MSDLAERLRRRAASERTAGGQLVYADPLMLVAAAEELEALRRELTDAKAILAEMYRRLA